jgi:acyl-coenzyme A thioesterase PaaI-like protein
MDPNEMNSRISGAFPALLGIRFVETGKERVVAELTIRDDLRTVGGALHGGTLMAFADTVGRRRRS